MFLFIKPCDHHSNKISYKTLTTFSLHLHTLRFSQVLHTQAHNTKFFLKVWSHSRVKKRLYLYNYTKLSLTQSMPQNILIVCTIKKVNAQIYFSLVDPYIS